MDETIYRDLQHLLTEYKRRVEALEKATRGLVFQVMDRYEVPLHAELHDAAQGARMALDDLDRFGEAARPSLGLRR